MVTEILLVIGGVIAAIFAERGNNQCLRREFVAFYGEEPKEVDVRYLELKNQRCPNDASSLLHVIGACCIPSGLVLMLY